jgi:hypothetical protein
LYARVGVDYCVVIRVQHAIVLLIHLL